MMAWIINLWLHAIFDSPLTSHLHPFIAALGMLALLVASCFTRMYGTSRPRETHDHNSEVGLSGLFIWSWNDLPFHDHEPFYDHGHLLTHKRSM